MAPSTTTAEPIYSIFQDEEDFRELLADFYDSAQQRRGVLQDSFQTGQLGTIRVHAHQLKGAGGGYGFEGLSDIAAQLEDACKSDQPRLDEIGPLLDDVVDYLGRIRI
jgi:histidine phosphotransfer protein HptB